MESKRLLVTYKLPILATGTALMTWYWMLLGCQSRTKHRLKNKYAEKGEVFDRYFGNDPEMLSVDRIVANTQEQMMPFLCALWLHAIFVSPSKAGKLGFCWVALRILYSFLMPRSLKNIQPKTVLLATGPQYLIVAYLFLSTTIRAFKAS